MAAEISENVRKAAQNADAAVAAAVRQPSPKAVGAVEIATNRLHKLYAGHLPGNGLSRIKAARAELRYSVPGEACQKLRDYLRDLIGTSPTSQAVVEAAVADEAAPARKSTRGT